MTKLHLIQALNMMKKIFYVTFLVLIGCNSSKTALTDSVIMVIPAYHIENSNDFSFIKSMMASSKMKSGDVVFFNNTKYPVSKIDSILKSDHKTDYSLIIKNDTLRGLRTIFLVPRTK
jgi:hypothetical protein